MPLMMQRFPQPQRRCATTIFPLPMKTSTPWTREHFDRRSQSASVFVCVCRTSYLGLREKNSPLATLRQRKLHRLRVADAARPEAAHVGHVSHRAARRAAHQARNYILCCLFFIWWRQIERKYYKFTTFRRHVLFNSYANYCPRPHHYPEKPPSVPMLLTRRALDSICVLWAPNCIRKSWSRVRWVGVWVCVCVFVRARSLDWNRILYLPWQGTDTRHLTSARITLKRCARIACIESRNPSRQPKLEPNSYVCMGVNSNYLHTKATSDRGSCGFPCDTDQADV